MAKDLLNTVEDIGVSTTELIRKMKPTPFKLTQQPTVAGFETPSISSESEPVVDLVKEFAPATIYDDLGELPGTYGSGTVFLAARDPHWLFVYWDADLDKINPTLLLDNEKAFYLKIFAGGGELVDQIKVNTEAQNWYFPVKEAGREYFVELGYNDPNSKWTVVGTSNDILAPADAFSEGIAEFATLPFHLSFQKIIDLIAQEVPTGETLVGALSKLQKSGDPALRALASTWTPEQRALLEALVGPELVAQIALGSANVDQLFKQRLSEVLSSPGASELSFLNGSSSEVLAALGNSLSSTAGASWSQAVGVGGSSGGASWESAKAFGSEVVGSRAGASFGAAGATGSGQAFGPTSASASWLAGLGGLSSAETSSWQTAVLSGVSSWLAGLAAGSWESAGFALGSWPGAAVGSGSSENVTGFGSSSWFGASSASLGGSSGLSSWEASHGGLASSWGGSSWPSSLVDAAWGGSSWSAFASGSERGLLDVRAEVVFHGKTHPGAKVWIDGKPVTPAPDGSFHLHMTLSSKGSEVPIVATFADGSEVKSAKLSWK